MKFLASDVETGIFEEEAILSEVFTFRESLRARIKELKHAFSLLRRSPLFVFGFLTILFLVFLAIGAPFITNYGPKEFALDPLESYAWVREPPFSEDQRAYLVWSDFASVSHQFNLNAEEMPVRSFYLDMNNDSRLDILLGTNDSQLFFYQFVAEEEPKPGESPWAINETYPLPLIPENVTRVSPTAGDIDGDNDIDIVIGGDDGKVYLSKNNGSAVFPEWLNFTVLTDDGGSEISFGGQAHPTLVDIGYTSSSKKGLLDLVVGSTDYKIHVYMNVGTTSNPSFQYDPFRPKDLTGIFSLPITPDLGNGSMRVNFALIDPDDRLDIVVIFDSGHYHYFLSFELVRDPSFTLLNKYNASVTFDFPLIAEDPFIDFHWTDFTNDNRSDLLLFTNASSVLFNYQYLQPDGRIHYFGTDELAGDIFSRCIWALQIDLILAIWVVAIAILIGVLVGSVSGYFGGWVDQLTMRITDVFFAFPGLILAMAIAAALGRNMFNLSIALIVTWWSGYARIVRGQVIAEKNKLYVDAARSIGLGNRRIILRHVLPNCIYPILVQATLDLGGVVLVAAGLSFIGFGASAGDAELGRMIADGRTYFIQAPWIVFFPGLFIFLIVLSFNLIGDGIRDVLDPKLRR